jgi:hypothetical protein
MRGANRDRECVDPDISHEGGCLAGVGAHSGGVGPVRATHLTQLRLEVEAVGVRPVGGGSGAGHVAGELELGRVDHYRAEPGGRCPVQHRLVLDVVQVQ